MKCTSLSLETQVEKTSKWCFLLIDFHVYFPLLFLGPSGSLRCWKPAWKSLSSLSLWSRTISKIRWTLRTFPGWFPASENDRLAESRWFWILTDLILIGMKCHHWKGIFNKGVWWGVDRGSWCQGFSVGVPLQEARCWSQPCAASSCSSGTASRRWSAGSASSAGPASPPGTPWMSSPWSSTPRTKGAQNNSPFSLHSLP